MPYCDKTMEIKRVEALANKAIMYADFAVFSVNENLDIDSKIQLRVEDLEAKLTATLFALFLVTTISIVLFLNIYYNLGVIPQWE